MIIKEGKEVAVRFQAMRHEDINEVAQLTVQSYKSNPLVKQRFVDIQAIILKERKTLQLLLQAQEKVNKQLHKNTIFCFVTFNLKQVFRYNGKIILSFTSCEYHYYVTNLLQKIELKMLVETVQQQFNKYPKRLGQFVYENWIIIDKGWMSLGIGKIFLQQISAYFTSQGYFYSYGFTSNPISYRILSSHKSTHLVKELTYLEGDKKISVQYVQRDVYKMVKTPLVHL